MVRANRATRWVLGSVLMAGSALGFGVTMAAAGPSAGAASPISLQVPLIIVGNVIGGHSVPSTGAGPGGPVKQTGALVNLNIPVNLCSLSVGLLASAASSCSTTTIASNQTAGLANINVPISIYRNAIGLLTESSTVTPLASITTTSGTAAPTTTQSGTINGNVP